MLALTKREAILEGKKVYSTGKQCKLKHAPARYVSSDVCVHCHRLNVKKYRFKVSRKNSELTKGLMTITVQIPTKYESEVKAYVQALLLEVD